MQTNRCCYAYDAANKRISVIQLQADHMNGGYMPKPDHTSYNNPGIIPVGKNETLFLDEDGTWQKTPFYIGTILHSITDQSYIKITEIGKTPSDYAGYAEWTLSQDEKNYMPFYDYTDGAWVFNTERYKVSIKKQITKMCETENYNILPHHIRDNIYAGSPASDDYPAYLQGETGRRSIAKLNKIYKDISDQTMTAIQSLATRAEIDAVIASIVFPTEDEVLTQILSE